MKKKSNAAQYAAIFPLLKAAAKKHGYALAIHGTMVRDFDLIAVPWIYKASKPETLIRALCASVGARFRTYNNIGGGQVIEQPEQKPHGRQGWVIHLNGPYLDISVIPPVGMTTRTKFKAKGKG